ncbi:MAG: DNA polymerase domain-containing protein [Candidatus Hermodarchaeota archaeon]
MDFQEQFNGWLLDVSTNSNGVILWVKTVKEEKIVKIFHDFYPEFFAVPKKHAGKDFKRLKQILKSHHNVKDVRICEKYVKLEDHEKTKIFGVSVIKPSVFKKTIKEIDEIGLFTLYNTDLPISQMYFYVNDLFPMSLCSFRVKLENKKRVVTPSMRLMSLELNDDNEELFYDLPPLKAVWLDIKVQQRGMKSYFNDPLLYAEVSIVEKDEKANIPRADGLRKRKILIDKADEAETIKSISKVIERLDPDIILTHGGDEFVFPYLAARASVNQVSKDLYFSRTKTPLGKCIFNLSGNSDHYMSYGIIMRRSKTQVYFTGRFHLDTTTYGSLHFSEGNIPGVIEVARVSRVPMQRLCRVTIGGALQSIQYYNAYKLDHLIPPFKKSPEGFRNGMDLITNDRGGHIFEPLIGVFDQVVELDFSSMYPSLMANFNISSETINCKCCKDDGMGIKVPGLNFHICTKRQGIISKSISLPLRKRLECKEYNKTHDDLRYKFTDIALKWVLVVSFGYLGFKNARFGKIEAHQTVCAFAREFLLRSAEIAKKYDCKVVHGIVDSMWLQDTKGRTPEEFEKLTKSIAKEISESTGIPMSWDGRFNTIVFLPSRAEPDIPALSHYWGIKSNGEIKVRGIEVRRRDMPKIVKDAQYAFIDVFQGAMTVDEFKKRISEAKKKLFEYVERVYSGKVSRDDLTIKQKLSRSPNQYKVNSYQAVAARQLERSGVIASAGKNVRYIILNADADPNFPEKKVILSDLYDEKKHEYDRKKYVELLKRAFENIFPFEFPELEELLTSDYNKKSLQKDLSCFI